MSGTKIAASRRLNQAVRQNRAFSTAGLLEILFTVAFKGLVYPQIWEDPEVDMEALANKNNSKKQAPSFCTLLKGLWHCRKYKPC